MIKRTRFKIGDVVRIPLPNEQFAYARILEDYYFAIYNLISHTSISIQEVLRHDISFYAGCTDLAVKNGEWPIIGHQDFLSPGERWGPPQATMYHREKNVWTMGGPRVYERGETKVATVDEVRGLDVMSVCNRPEQLVDIIIDRVINGNHLDYKVKVK